MSPIPWVADTAIGILAENDRGHDTVPTKGLYPFQGTSESCFTALGQSHYDPDRAWTAGHAVIADAFAGATPIN